MKRLSTRHYNLWVTGLMVAYVGLLLLVWPQAKSDAPVPLRALLALLPALPVIAVTVVMAWRVLSSDELEQRLHMDALGLAASNKTVARAFQRVPLAEFVRLPFDLFRRALI